MISTHAQPSARTASASLSSFVRRQPVEQCGVGQVAFMLGLEQVAADDAAGRDIGVDADEARPPVVAPRHGRRSGCAGWRRGVVEVRLLEPCRFLRRVIVRHGEGHQLVEVHFLGAVERRSARADGGELQPLAHDGRACTPKRAAISSGPLPVSASALKPSNWSAGCIGSRTMFSARLISPASSSVEHVAGDLGRPWRWFLSFASSLSAARRRPPATTSNLPPWRRGGLAGSATGHARRCWRRVRRCRRWCRSCGHWPATGPACSGGSSSDVHGVVSFWVRVAAQRCAAPLPVGETGVCKRKGGSQGPETQRN